MDDTIISSYGGAETAWHTVARELARDLVPLSPSEVADAVTAFAREFWADADRHRFWRLRLTEARREIVDRSV
ncbi:MAG: HAD family hydrolase, partial [Longimicrobiales bacterium]